MKGDTVIMARYASWHNIRESLKIEGLKTATKIALLFLMASFFKTRLFIVVSHFVTKQQFSAIQKLKLFSLLKIKEVFRDSIIVSV